MTPPLPLAGEGLGEDGTDRAEARASFDLLFGCFGHAATKISHIVLVRTAFRLFCVNASDTRTESTH